MQRSYNRSVACLLSLIDEYPSLRQFYNEESLDDIRFSVYVQLYADQRRGLLELEDSTKKSTS
jgi:hypothetical protein